MKENKKFAALLFLMIFVCGMFTVTAYGDYSGTVIYGDMNHDNVVDMRDYDMLYAWWYDTNPETMGSPLNDHTLLAVDLDDDARATGNDIIMLKSYLDNNDTARKQYVAGGFYEDWTEWRLYEEDCCWVDYVMQEGYCMIIND